MKEREPGYYAIIPAEIRYNPKLSASEKLLYGEITALAQKEGYCFASSEYFEKHYGVSRKTVYNWIKNLQETGHISVKLLGKNGCEGREIYITHPGKETTQSPVKKSTRKQYKYNNTSINSSASVNGTGSPEFNSIENMSAIQELECQTKWGKILKVWVSNETSPILKQSYSKFKALRTEHQDEVVQYIESLPEAKRKLLSDLWISTYLKNNMLHPGILDRDLEKKLTFTKPKKDPTTILNGLRWDKDGNPLK